MWSFLFLLVLVMYPFHLCFDMNEQVKWIIQQTDSQTMYVYINDDNQDQHCCWPNNSRFAPYAYSHHNSSSFSSSSHVTWTIESQNMSACKNKRNDETFLVHFRHRCLRKHYIHNTNIPNESVREMSKEDVKEKERERGTERKIKIQRERDNEVLFMVSQWQT